MTFQELAIGEQFVITKHWGQFVLTKTGKDKAVYSTDQFQIEVKPDEEVRRVK